jgi:serine protease Do
MRSRTFCGLVVLLLFQCPTLTAGSEQPSRSYPLPLVEMERVIYQWFADSAIKVTRDSTNGDKVLFKASSEEASWQVVLRPRSALATEISAQCVFHKQSSRDRVDELWSYIAEYIKDTQAVGSYDHEVTPEALLVKSEAVVCIDVELKTSQIGMSGFIISPKGLILSTAHDLKGVKDMTVTLQDGRKFKGQLVRTDFQRDLALIDIMSEVDAFISLSEGRGRLKEGDRLFSVTCPDGARVTSHSAVIIGPPRVRKNLLLWQVSMKTLPGSSGGPVFDEETNLVAMVLGRFRGTDSVGFLVPLETIREFLSEQ